MGRHSHPDEMDDADGADEPVTEADGERAVTPKTSAVADLQFLLHNPRLLAACSLAVLLPFACYFAVIVSLKKMGDWALFIGAPMVLAGVLIGALLDRAYSNEARAARRAETIQQVTVPASAVPAARDSHSAEGVRP